MERALARVWQYISVRGVATPRTSLQTRDAAVLWHPCGQMLDYETCPPLAITGAQGGWLTLDSGQRVFDVISSWWCKSLGHAHPRLQQALINQANKYEHVIVANTTNEPLVSLCERLVAMANGAPPQQWASGAHPQHSDGHFGKVFFADNGSTAVEVALKLAIQAQAQRGQPQRTGFVALQNGYHGETIGALSVGDCGLYKDTYKNLLFPCTMLQGLPYRSGDMDPTWFDASDEWPGIEKQLNTIAETTAAIVYEPILQGAGGMLLYSPDLLRRLRAWANTHGVFLIADEIAAGMGRCGAMLASHVAGLDVLPDMAVLSKGLTGGFLPFAAVLTTNAIYADFYGTWDSKRAFLHSNTYAGNALGVAVAHAVLDVFNEEYILDAVAQHGPLLRQGLKYLSDKSSFYYNVRGVGMMAAVDIRDSRGLPFDASKRIGWQIYQAAMQRGLLLRPLGDTLYLFPPLNSTPAEITYALGIVDDSIRSVVK